MSKRIVIGLLSFGFFPAFGETPHHVDGLGPTLRSNEGYRYVTQAQKANNRWQDHQEQCKVATISGAALMCKEQIDSELYDYDYLAMVKVYVAFVKHNKQLWEWGYVDASEPQNLTIHLGNLRRNNYDLASHTPPK